MNIPLTPYIGIPFAAREFAVGGAGGQERTHCGGGEQFFRQRRDGGHDIGFGKASVEWLVSVFA
ncbi:hypothetical protein OG203_15510 [Nocardia sp. NBC_01499]|uniref:hypothetical protein n=1 Tax=Nocardia sp. NBC_01499 TaxID=2903597 RepID=UPI00386F5801